jgi:hypothetical protein
MGFGGYKVKKVDKGRIPGSRKFEVRSKGKK